MPTWGEPVEEIANGIGHQAKKKYEQIRIFAFLSVSIKWHQKGSIPERVSKCGEMRFRVDWAAFQGDFPQAQWD